MPGLMKSLFSRKKLEPSYPVLPLVDEKGETNISGIYAVGELAGTPLVKLGLNAGHDLVEHLAPDLKASGQSHDSEFLDIVIIGSGSSGLAASVSAQAHGLSYVTLEAAAFANIFVTMTKGKLLFAEPATIENRSGVWFEECKKEELLERWRQLVKEKELNIHEHERVTAITGNIDNFKIKTDGSEYSARRVLLCMGKAGNPRKLGVPGEKENATKIYHRLLDPDDFHNKDIIIVGAGDVSCEAAIALASDPSNHVTMTAVDKEFAFPKKRNIDAVYQLEKEGKLRIILNSAIKRIDQNTVDLHCEGKKENIKYGVIFEMIGAELPIRFLRDTGIRLNTDWPFKKWMGLAVVFLFVYSLSTP